MELYEKNQLKNTAKVYEKWIKNQPKSIKDFERAHEILVETLTFMEEHISNLSTQIHNGNELDSYFFFCYDNYMDKEDIIKFFVTKKEIKIDANNFLIHQIALTEKKNLFQEYLKKISSQIELEKLLTELASIRLEKYKLQISDKDSTAIEIKELHFCNKHEEVSNKLEAEISNSEFDELFDVNIPKVIQIGIEKLFDDDDFLQLSDIGFNLQKIQEEKNKLAQTFYPFARDYVLKTLYDSIEKNRKLFLDIFMIAERIELELQKEYEKTLNSKFKGKFIDGDQIAELTIPTLRKPRRNELKELLTSIKTKLNLTNKTPLTLTDRRKIYKEVLRNGIISDRETIDTVLRRLGFKSHF